LRLDKLMRHTIIALTFFLLLASTVSAEVAIVAPDWALVSAEHESVRLSEEVRRQPVVLFFWATWCPYCKALMPHLQSLRLEHGDEIKILAINFMDADGDPVGYIRNAGYDFVVLPGGDAVAEAYRVYGTPGVIIVDQEQNIRFDLRSLPGPNLPTIERSANNKRKAAYIAPYWAAEIRKGIDQVLSESTR
jgi:thiol-disulfide isomerase/thioredoxin